MYLAVDHHSYFDFLEKDIEHQMEQIEMLPDVLEQMYKDHFIRDEKSRLSKTYETRLSELKVIYIWCR
jgi:hypothetical protein